LDNPWWQAGSGIDPDYRQFPRRAYLGPFLRLIRQSSANRAIVLMGPRRVGKTILAYHAIQALLDDDPTAGRNILYLSLETPLLTGLRLDSLVERFRRLFSHSAGQPLYVFFDEIQYLKDWEVHLKSLVDTYRHCRFIATGSAAAALKTRSAESGAGRFTEFVLPPLTFAEYLRFVGREDELVQPAPPPDSHRYECARIHELNEEFINYLNFGGYPEAVFSPAVQANARRFIKSDIIDKVLLRDLPILYGISDIQELNSLFNNLAYNTAREVSLEELSKTANVAKNTLTRYLDYLEAAFLIRRIRRVDETAAQFRRRVTFKVYLTNPTMRCALFGPVSAEHEAMGSMAETAVFSQWLHNAELVDGLHYARWKSGEVDLVSLDAARQRPQFAVEVKWSDAAYADNREIKGLLDFAARHPLKRLPLVTTISRAGVRRARDQDVEFTPVSLHCYTVGKNTLDSRGDPAS
jgi:predicted AAA+ superfamily ATPase